MGEDYPSHSDTFRDKLRLGATESSLIGGEARAARADLGGGYYIELPLGT